MQNSNVLSFERPADFYFDTAMKHLDALEYPEALPFLRRAIEKDEENIDYLLTYSEVLTEIGKFHESNSVIFDMLKKGLLHTECYFGLGCNFLGINDTEKARQSFETYLMVDPDGEYSQEAMDFLTYVDELSAEPQEMTDVIKKQNLELADEGKRLLDSGNFRDAILSLERVSDDTLSYARNNLALAYFFAKKTERAIEISKRVIKRDKNNIHALCNLAMFYAEKDDLFELTQILKMLEKVKTDIPEDIFKMAMTYCDLDLHAKAYAALNNYISYRPYDEKALFFLSLASFNTKKFDSAVEYMSKLIKIDPGNTVAQYYLGYMKSAEKGSDKKLGYICRVPEKETNRRIAFINSSLDASEEEALKKWQKDNELSDLIYWALKDCDINFKLAVSGIIAEFGDKKAEDMLRRYLVDADQPDAVKHHIFLLLKSMGAEEPFVATIGGSLVEAKVEMPENTAETDKENQEENENDK